MRRLSVIYSGTPSEDLDKKLTKAMEALGVKWYAQGYNFVDHERDICFDLEDNPEESIDA